MYAKTGRMCSHDYSIVCVFTKIDSIEHVPDKMKQLYSYFVYMFE